MGDETHGGPYKSFVNSIYGTPAGMAMAAPLAIAGTPRSQFRWGGYHKRVVPHRALWPTVTSPRGTVYNTWDVYKRGNDLLRAGLVAAPNTDPLSPDEPNVIPRTRLDLLDEAIQKAFYSNPPIPYDMDVQNSSDGSYNVRLAWDMDASGKPVMLHITIVSPPQGNAPASP